MCMPPPPAVNAPIAAGNSSSLNMCENKVFLDFSRLDLNQYRSLATAQSHRHQNVRPSCVVHTADTPAMPSLLALLLALLAAASASTVWHRAMVTQDQLASASRTQTFQVSEEILCAIIATNTPWSHLFTQHTSGCVLYDLLMDSLTDPPPEDQDSAACWTRHCNDEAPLATGNSVVSPGGLTII